MKVILNQIFGWLTSLVKAKKRIKTIEDYVYGTLSAKWNQWTVDGDDNSLLSCYELATFCKNMEFNGRIESIIKEIEYEFKKVFDK